MLESIQILPPGLPISNRQTIQSLFRQLDPQASISLSRANDYMQMVSRMCKQLNQLKILQKQQKKTYCQIAILICIFFLRVAVEKNKKITDLDALLGNVALLLHNLDEEQFLFFSKKIATASYQASWENSLLTQLTSSNQTTLVVANIPSCHTALLSRVVILTIKCQPMLLHHYLDHYLLDTLVKSTDFPLYFLKQTAQFSKLLFMFDKLVELRQQSHEMLCYNLEKLIFQAKNHPSLKTAVFQSYIKIRQIVRNSTVLTKLLLLLYESNHKYAQQVLAKMTGRLHKLSTILLSLSDRCNDIPSEIPPISDKELSLARTEPYELLILDECINIIQKPRSVLFQKWQKSNIINNLSRLNPETSTVELIRLQCQLIHHIPQPESKKYGKLLPINQYLLLIHCLITNKQLNFSKLHSSQDSSRCFQIINFILCSLIEKEYRSAYLASMYNLLRFCQEDRIVKRMVYCLERVREDMRMVKEILMMIERKDGKCVFMLYSMKNLLRVEDIEKIDGVVDAAVVAGYEEQLIKLVSNRLLNATKEISKEEENGIKDIQLPSDASSHRTRQSLQITTILENLSSTLEGYVRMYKVRKQTNQSTQDDSLYMHFYLFTSVVLNELHRISTAFKDPQHIRRLEQCIYQLQSMQNISQPPIIYFSRIQQQFWKQNTSLHHLLLTYTILLDLEQSRRREFKEVTIDRCLEDMFVSMATTVPIMARLKAQLRKYDVIGNITTLNMSVMLRCLEILRNMAHHHGDQELAGMLTKIKSNIYESYGNEFMSQYEMFKMTRKIQCLSIPTGDSLQELYCLMTGQNHSSTIVKLSMLMQSSVSSVEMWKAIVKQMTGIRRYQSGKPSTYTTLSPYSILKIPDSPLCPKSFNQYVVPYEQSRLCEDMSYCLLPQALVRGIECMSDNEQKSEIDSIIEHSLRYLSRFNNLQGCLKVLRRHEIIEVSRLFDWMSMLQPQISPVRERLFNRRKSMATRYNLDKFLEDVRMFNRQFAKILISYYCQLHSQPIFKILEYQKKLQGLQIPDGLQELVKAIYDSRTPHRQTIMYLDGCSRYHMANQTLLRVAIFIMDFNYHYKKCCFRQPKYEGDPSAYLELLTKVHQDMQKYRRNVDFTKLFQLKYSLHVILPYGKHLLTISVHNRMVTVRKKDLEMVQETIETFKRLLERAETQLRMTKKKADWWKDRERINRDMGRLVERIRIGPLPQNNLSASQSAVQAYANSLFSCTQAQFVQAIEQFGVSQQEKTHLLNQYRNNTHEIQGLPCLLYIWPSISLFPYECATDSNSIYRLPSVEYVFQRKFQDSHANLMNLRYLVNPSMDLQNTEDNFRELRSSYKSWEGIAGRQPTNKEYLNLLSKDIFMYMGHGAGSQYTTNREIYERQSGAAAFLFGCSSVKMQQKTSEPCGLALTFLMSSCPAVFGCLWDVTDRDIDKCVERICKSVQANPTDLSKIVQQTKKQAMKLCRQCRMEYLNGSALVIYGMPCNIYS